MAELIQDLDPIARKLRDLGLDDDIASDLWKAIKKDKQDQQEWRSLARQCYDFEAGHQWDEDDLAILEEQGRPPVVFNRIARTVNAIAGLEIQNRQQVEYIPRELTDSGLSELLTGAARYVRDNCDAEDEESDSFRDLLICGMGWTETRMDYERNLDGDVLIDRIDPMEMGWDCASKDKNLDDARRVWRACTYSRKDAAQMWTGQDFAPGEFWDDYTERDHDADDAWKYENNQTEGAREGDVTVIQVQWYEVQGLNLVISESGRMIQFDDEKFRKIADYVMARGLRHERISKRVYYQAFLSGEHLLDIDVLSCNEFTLRCMTGVRDRNKKCWLGIVSYMLDPQRWANKWMSQAMYILNSNSKGGLLAEVDAFKNARAAEDNWSSPDAITWLNPGGLNKIKEKGQTQYPVGFDKLMTNAIEAITDVTGVNMEMLGLAGASNQVGLIEASRKQSGISLLGPYFDGLRRYRKEQGRVLAHYIQQYLSDGRLVRIVGQMGAQYVPLLKQPDALRYDVVVDDAPSSPNMKQQAFHVLMEIMPMLIPAGMMPPPDMLDLLPLPASFIQKWKESMQRQPDPAEEMAKRLALMDKQQEISESKSKETLNYAKAQSEGVKPAVDIERARNERAATELNAFRTGADVANPGRGML